MKMINRCKKMITTLWLFIPTFANMRQRLNTDEFEQQRRREATQQLTMRYLALKESQRDVTDMTVEEHAEEIMEEVNGRLARLKKQE